jgi:hypothetical protein
MKNNILKLGSIAILSTAIVSCGGSGGSGTTVTDNTGVFLDSAVAGLYYTSSPSGKSGRTDDFGQFNYTTGDTVEFKVGGTATGAVLGSVAAKAVIMPEDIADGATGTKSAKIAILLQSMDADGDANNGIDLGNNIINSTMAATIKAILDSPLESGTHTFSANNIASFTAKTVASATAHLTTKASATAHIAKTKKNKDSAPKTVDGKLILFTKANTGENGGSISQKYTKSLTKSGVLSSATSKVSVDFALADYVINTTGTYSSSAFAQTSLVANFVNRTNASDTFKVIIKVYADKNNSRSKLYVQCDLSSICESGSTATSAVAYISQKDASLIDTSTSDKSAANYTKGVVRTASIEYSNNASHTFTINGVEYDGTGDFVSLSSSDNYDFTTAVIANTIFYPDDSNSSTSSFDNFTVMSGTKTVHIDTFDKGLDNDIWNSITTKTE